MLIVFKQEDYGIEEVQLFGRPFPSLPHHIPRRDVHIRVLVYSKKRHALIFEERDECCFKFTHIGRQN